MARSAVSGANDSKMRLTSAASSGWFAATARVAGLSLVGRRASVRRWTYWSARTDATSVKDGKLRLQVLISELERGGYESAARRPADDIDALVVHLRYPLRLRERWRSTNLLERSLGEVRRRTKVMGRFPGEASCLSFVWAVLDLFFGHASNGATFTDVDRQHLYRINYHQVDPDTLDEEVTAA